MVGDGEGTFGGGGGGGLAKGDTGVARVGGDAARTNAVSAISNEVKRLDPSTSLSSSTDLRTSVRPYSLSALRRCLLRYSACRRFVSVLT